MSELEFEIGEYLVSTTTGFGPRILGVRRGDGPDLLARLPDEVGIELSDGGTYRFRGGHRLWAAPEVPAITYAPDDHACDVTKTDEGLSIGAPADTAGLAKELRISAKGGSLLVDHHLTNSGSGPVGVAGWGITQFRLGGTAIAPTGTPSPGLQADRSVVLWPYTDPSDDRLAWTDAAVLVDAVSGAKLKIGIGPDPEHLGYFLDGYLFTKTIPAAGEGDFPDRGAVGQVFVNEDFCELESVGPIQTLAPGSSISLRETWTLAACPDLETARQRVSDRGSE